MMTVKDHEKFIAFMALLLSLILVMIMLRLWPLADNNTNSGVIQIINLIVGALIGGFGAAVQKLLQADKVTVDNSPANPVNTTDTSAPATNTGELPESEKL